MYYKVSKDCENIILRIRDIVDSKQRRILHLRIQAGHLTTVRWPHSFLQELQSHIRILAHR